MIKPTTNKYKEKQERTRDLRKILSTPLINPFVIKHAPKHTIKPDNITWANPINDKIAPGLDI